jgi:hypothetical protein
VADLRGELASSLLVARDTGDGAVSGRFLTEPGHFMWLRAHADNPLRDGGQITTHLDYDDARVTTTQLNASTLDDPGFRFLLQLTAPGVGQTWTSARDGRTLVRVGGDGGAWAELNPATSTVTQGGPTDLFDHIEQAATMGPTRPPGPRQARHHRRASRPDHLARHTPAPPGRWPGTGRPIARRP